MMLLTACDSEDKTISATQVVAKVNDEEISVHQLNFLLSSSDETGETEVKELSNQLLKQLVDESLKVQQAKELKLDRSQRILLALEDAKRKVLAQAWLDRTNEAAISNPSLQEISAFYEAHPELFKQRKIYQLKELSIDQTPENEQVITQLIQSSANIDVLAANLEKEKIVFKLSLSTESAEKLPMEHLIELSGLNNGRFISFAKEDELQVMGVLSTKDEPILEAKAQPLIETFLINSKIEERTEQAMEELRKAAKIEYKGDFSSLNQPSANPELKEPVAEPEAAKPIDATKAAINKGMAGLK
jgi:EpsD family peptidyl-prolyl cis-trans isomerase